MPEPSRHLPAFVQRFLSRMEPAVFLPAAGLVIGFVAFSTLFTPAARAVFDALQAAILARFGWFYLLAASTLLVAMVYLVFGRYGSIRLGGPDATPEFGYLGWFAMLLSAGMGIGIVFFGSAEPLLHYLQPPVGEGSTPDALREAMRFTLFHWGLHPWAIYCAFALPLAYYHFRHGLPLAPRSLLYPILGERIRGPIGHAVDVLCTVGTLFGVATSLGLGALQINAGFHRLFGMPQGVGPQLGLIAAITAVATISVLSGLARGIRTLSQINLCLAGVLLVFVLAAGPTVFIAELFVDGLGYYLQKLPYTSLRIRPGTDNTWQAHWTLFYWSWWISWSPFVGVFVARISRGRTVREFLVTAMLVPSLGGYLWFAAFGGTALHLEMFGSGAATSAALENEALALFAVLETLPWHEFTWALATALVIIFFISSSDSGSLVDDMVTSGGHPNPPAAQRLFWAIAEGAVAAVLLYAGGLQALRTASLTTGIPIALFLLVATLGTLRALSIDARAEGVPKTSTLGASQNAADDAGD